MSTRGISIDILAQMIDISAVQASHGEAEVRRLSELARIHNFKGAHVLPCWVSTLRNLLGEDSRTLVGASVGFPGGGNTTEVKLFETRQLIRDGVQEIDMMLNIGKQRSGDYPYVEKEIKEVVRVAHNSNIPVKVIIEVGYLNLEEIRKACEICIGTGADFVKTGSGWGPSGATLEVVEFITSVVGSAIKVKAAGGIRSLDMVKKLYQLGVQRFGINTDAAVSILNEVSTLPKTDAQL